MVAVPHFCCGRLIRGNYHPFYQPKCKAQFTLLAGSRKGILQLRRDEEAHGKDAWNCQGRDSIKLWRRA